MTNESEAIATALPEYGEWLPDVWEAYLLELTGWEHRRGWAQLPATFRWHEFHERLAQAIEARRAETGTGAVHESAVRQDAPKPNCDLGSMHGMVSTFLRQDGTRCCDFCGHPVACDAPKGASHD